MPHTWAVIRITIDKTIKYHHAGGYVKWLNILASAFSWRAAFFQTELMCREIFTLQSITTPNTLTCFSETITVFSFSVRFRALLSSDVIIINWILSGFNCIPFSVNHLMALLPSSWRFDITWSIVGDVQGRELWSAPLYKVHSFMNMCMSLMKALNDKGPRMELWGTPFDKGIIHPLYYQS